MTYRATALIGRDSELGILAKFLEHAAAEGGAFLLVGEPGAGKTALLDAAAAAAAEAGTAVLRAAGVEFEADLTYSGLHQVLLPALSQFERLSAAHRDALNVALGYGEGPRPSSMIGCARLPGCPAPGGRRQPGGWRRSADGCRADQLVP